MIEHQLDSGQRSVQARFRELSTTLISPGTDEASGLLHALTHVNTRSDYQQLLRDAQRTKRANIKNSENTGDEHDA